MSRWPMVPLGKVARIFNGKTPAKSEHRGSGHPVLKIKDLSGDGNFSGSFGSFVEPSLAARHESRTVKSNDTVILNSAHNASHVASKICRVPESASGALAVGEWTILRSVPGSAEQDYLFFWLSSPQTAGVLRDLVRGIHLYPKDIATASIPLPPLDEQRRIVDLLNRGAGIRRLREQALATARNTIPALFLQTFGDPATNPKGWPVVELGTLGELDRGKSRHRPRNDPQLLGGPHPFLQTGDVANSNGIIERFASTYSDFGLAQSRKWPKGTLCITIAANIAATGVLQFDACFPDSVVGFRPGPSVTSEYVQAIIDRAKSVLEQNAPQAAQKNLNLKILRALPTPLPPLDLQRRFADRLADLRGIVTQQERALATARALERALLARLLE
jgi:type I restriction enzyme, S subunit